MSLWVRSPNFHPGRRAPLRWIVWHSTESSEVTGGAHNVAAGWFAKPASKVSAHIVVDDGSDPRYPDGVVECVKPVDTAWHAARANAAGYGVEVIGRAGQGVIPWMDPYSKAAVRNACRWLRSHPHLTHIPPRWLTDAQLRNNELGHIVHSQVSRVLGGTDHTDPGLGFPYAYVMEQLGVVDGRTLRRGSAGWDVAHLQRRLNELFAEGLTEDGVFGPLTEAAVRRFQGRTSIQVDGVVGPQTWEVLRTYRT